MSAFMLEMLPFLGAILVAVLTWIGVTVARKIGYEVKEKKIREWIETVVLYVEELAAERLRGTDPAMTTSEKKRTAQDMVRAKYADVDYLDTRILDVVHRLGLGAAAKELDTRKRDIDLAHYVAKGEAHLRVQEKANERQRLQAIHDREEQRRQSLKDVEAKAKEAAAMAAMQEPEDGGQ